MKIISDYHDYYDVVQHQHYDDNIVYVRKSKNSEREVSLELKRRLFVPYGRSIIFVCFCGKVYPVYILKDNFGHVKKISYTPFNELVENSIHQILIGWNSRNLSGVANYVNAVTSSIIKQNFFVELNIPLFTIKQKYPRENVGTDLDKCLFILDIAPNLADLQFYSIFDTYSAFQEIEMYMSNQLVVHDSPDQIKDDRVLRDSKGFDDRSFKKYPTKKR